MNNQIFNEQTLKSEIERVWGKHGAHADVFSLMLRKLAASTPSDSKPGELQFEQAYDLVEFLAEVFAVNISLENRLLWESFKRGDNPEIWKDRLSSDSKPQSEVSGEEELWRELFKKINYGFAGVDEERDLKTAMQSFTITRK